MTPEARGEAGGLATPDGGRREVEDLRALYDLAVDLVAITDRTALLQRIVSRARLLLGVDVGYLALLEEDATETDPPLRIRVTDGAVGPHLRGIRVHRRTGIAGQVLESEEPAQSEDYLNDPGLVHREDADEGIRGERLRALLGVPLLLAGSTVGVLMVADRGTRRFEPAEVRLLSSVATFAAIALDNSRLLAAHRAAAESAETANRLLRGNLQQADRQAEVEGRLLDVAARTSDPAAVVGALSQDVPGRLSLLDDRDRLRVAAEDGVVAPVPEGSGAAPTGTLRAVPDDAVHLPIAGAGARLGTLVWETTGPARPADAAIVERSAVVVALVLTSERAVAEADRRTTTELLAALLDVGDDDALLPVLRSRGFDGHRAHGVVVLGADEDGAATRALGRLTATTGGLLGRFAGRTVLVGPFDPGAWADELRDAIGVGVAGFAGPVDGLVALRDAHREAVRCVRVLEALGATGRVADAAALGPYRNLLTASGREELRAFVDRAVGPLLVRDDALSGDLTRTASTFLALGRRHAAVAAELHVHVNTLYQRLQRITDVLGPTWRTPDGALEVQLALRVRELMQRLAPDETAGADRRRKDRADAPAAR